MSASSSNVKLMAKAILKDNFLKTLIACTILTFSWILSINLAGLLSYVTGMLMAEIISAVMIIFIVLPLSLGVLRYIWRMIFFVCDNPISVFYWFSEKKLYIKAMKFIGHFVLRIAFWFILLNIPSILLYILSKSFVFELLGIATPLWTANLGYYSTFLTNISIAIVFLIMLKFYMAPLLFIGDEDIDVSEAMYTSSVIARKSSVDFVGLIFSSFGLIILSFFVLPLPFTLPFLLSYYVVHTRMAVTEYNQHIENSKFTEAGFI